MTIKPKTIYLSGAISGNPDYRKEFAFAEKELIKRGFAVVNPALRDGCDTWEEYMRADIADLVTKCDAVAIVNNILNSRGALLEYEIAYELGMEIRPLNKWLLSYSPPKNREAAMTRSEIKKLVKKELFRRINKGGTCFGPHIDYMAFVVQKAAGTLLHKFPNRTTKQEINLYGCAIEDAVEFFLSHASLEVKCEKSADNTPV